MAPVAVTKNATYTLLAGEVAVRSRSWINALVVVPPTAGGSYQARVTLKIDKYIMM